jgi:lipopolysaccharide transport system ATP-binding protein
MSKTAIDIQNLGKYYRIGSYGFSSFWKDLFRPGHSHPDSGQGGFWALKDVNFEVNKGDSVGIVGKNGAGKSTLLKILSRTTVPTTGNIRINGKVSSLLEVGTGFHPELTGRENIFLNGSIMGMRRLEVKARFDEIVDFAGVSDFLDTPVKRYSSGMYVRLAFAVAAHLETEILILDEVLAVGDVDFQNKCLGKMQEVTGNHGKTVLFVSHNISYVSSLCNKGIYLDKGIMKTAGPVDEVIRAYTFTSAKTIEMVPLKDRNDRSGTGSVRVVDYSVHDAHGNPIQSVLSGQDIIFRFRILVHLPGLRNLDFGLSMKDSADHSIFVLYSGYQKVYFDYPEPGEYTLECKISDFPFSKGRYKIGARVLVQNLEADWIHDGVGFINVESGDFYSTGSFGFDKHGITLIKGSWRKNS